MRRKAGLAEAVADGGRLLGRGQHVRGARGAVAVVRPVAVRVLGAGPAVLAVLQVPAGGAGPARVAVSCSIPACPRR